MSGVTPINGGQENTEGLCCCLGRDESSFKAAYRLPLIICLAKWGFVCFLNPYVAKQIFYIQIFIKSQHSDSLNEKYTI